MPDLLSFASGRGSARRDGMVVASPFGCGPPLSIYLIQASYAFQGQRLDIASDDAVPAFRSPAIAQVPEQPVSLPELSATTSTQAILESKKPLRDPGVRMASVLNPNVHQQSFSVRESISAQLAHTRLHNTRLLGDGFPVKRRTGNEGN